MLGLEQRTSHQGYGSKDILLWQRSLCLLLYSAKRVSTTEQENEERTKRGDKWVKMPQPVFLLREIKVKA